jgi:hypothetical protein
MTLPLWHIDAVIGGGVHPIAYDPAIVSGESGAVGAGLLYAITHDLELGALKEALGLYSTSRVLLISTEGDTSPDIYRSIVWLGGDVSDPFAPWKPNWIVAQRFFKLQGCS